MAVLDFLLNRTPPGLQHEACLLWQLLQCQLHFSWGDEEWTVDATTGVQQGAPLSAGIFSLIVGWALQKLFEVWECSGVQFQHKLPSELPLLGWAYVDDIILNLQTWPELVACFAALENTLQGLGLCINFDKTVIVLPDRMWPEARAFAATHPEHPVCRCKWRTDGVYLRKPFKPFQSASTVSGWALAAAGKLAHAGWEELAPVLHQCRWNHGLLPFVLLNRYVFAKFSWFGMMIEPLIQWGQGLDSLQCTMMCLSLQLYIPSSMKGEHAVCLHRLRRRMVYTCLQLNNKFRWLLLLMRRRWTYAGHLLRKPLNSLPLSIIAASNPGSIRQAVPAPWHSIYTWLVKQLQDLRWIEPHDKQPSIEQLQELAKDRDVWFQGWGRLEHQYFMELQYEHVFLWSSLRVALQAATAWKQTVAVAWACESWWLIWLSEIEGPARVAYDGHDFLHCVGYLRMECPDVWGLDFVVPQIFLDVHLGCVLSWVQAIWNTYGCVATFSVMNEVEGRFAVEFAGLQ